MASLLKNLKTIAPCLLAITVDSLGFGLVYPILTMMFGGAHRTLLGPGVSAAEADFLFGLGYMLYPAGMFFGASMLGDLSDRFGRKPVLLICMGGLSLATAMMAAGNRASQRVPAAVRTLPVGPHGRQPADRPGRRVRSLARGSNAPST